MKFAAMTWRQNKTKRLSYCGRNGPLGLGEIDGLHGTSTHSCALT